MDLCNVYVDWRVHNFSLQVITLNSNNFSDIGQFMKLPGLHNISLNSSFESFPWAPLNSSFILALPTFSDEKVYKAIMCTALIFGCSKFNCTMFESEFVKNKKQKPLVFLSLLLNDTLLGVHNYCGMICIKWCLSVTLKQTSRRGNKPLELII